MEQNPANEIISVMPTQMFWSEEASKPDFFYIIWTLEFDDNTSTDARQSGAWKIYTFKNLLGMWVRNENLKRFQMPEKIVVRFGACETLVGEDVSLAKTKNTIAKSTRTSTIN